MEEQSTVHNVKNRFLEGISTAATTARSVSKKGRLQFDKVMETRSLDKVFTHLGKHVYQLLNEGQNLDLHSDPVVTEDRKKAEKHIRKIVDLEGQLGHTGVA